MKRFLKYNLIALLAMALFMSSCNDDDYTGYSDLVPTENVSITVGGTGSFTLTEADSSYTFDVTLSAAQIVDVVLYANVTGGDATSGEDFKIANTGSRVYIPAGSTTGTLEIKILQDNLAEAAETFTVTIGDERTANATVDPVDVTFTLENYTENMLSIDMTWETDVADVIGLELDPDAVVDLRLLILNATDSSFVTGVDGSTFENYSGMDSLADGTYLIATDIYSTIDAGDYNAEVTIDVELGFNQSGVINNDILSLPGVMTNAYTLSDGYIVYLATITKSGDNYSYEASEWMINSLVGSWNGEDASNVFWTEPSQVVTEIVDEKLMVTGLGFGWMTNFWGEVIIDGGTVELVLNKKTGQVSIANQYYMTTTYGGEEQDPYTIVGSGRVYNIGQYPTMIIEYEMNNNATNWGAWMYDNGYSTYETFTAILTLDPSGKKIIDVSTTNGFDLSQKPRF